MDKNETGYFDLYSQILSAKVDSMTQYPYIFPFLDKAEDETDVDALKEIYERRDKFNDTLKELRDRADVTSLKPGTDYLKLWDVLDFTVKELLLRNIKSASFRADLFKQEANEYIDMIRKITTVQ